MRQHGAQDLAVERLLLLGKDKVLKVLAFSSLVTMSSFCSLLRAADLASSSADSRASIALSCSSASCLLRRHWVSIAKGRLAALLASVWTAHFQMQSCSVDVKAKCRQVG